VRALIVKGISHMQVARQVPCVPVDEMTHMIGTNNLLGIFNFAAHLHIIIDVLRLGCESMVMKN
jgi:hypothetical protein